MDKDKIIKAITEILDRGNDAEIRKKPDGQIVVYEVKKKAALSEWH